MLCARDAMRRLVPKRHAMLIVMSPISVRQPRIGDRIRTHIVSTDHGAGVVLPCCYLILGEQFAATMWTRVGHWHNVAVDVARCFRDLTNDAKSIRVVLAFCFARLEPRIGNAVGTLPRILLTGNHPPWNRSSASLRRLGRRASAGFVRSADRPPKTHRWWGHSGWPPCRTARSTAGHRGRHCLPGRRPALWQNPGAARRQLRAAASCANRRPPARTRVAPRFSIAAVECGASSRRQDHPVAACGRARRPPRAMAASPARRGTVAPSRCAARPSGSACAIAPALPTSRNRAWSRRRHSHSSTAAPQSDQAARVSAARFSVRSRIRSARVGHRPRRRALTRWRVEPIRLTPGICQSCSISRIAIRCSPCTENSQKQCGVVRCLPLAAGRHALPHATPPAARGHELRGIAPD